MKIILIHTEGEVDTAGELLSLLENMNILSETFPVESTEDKGQFAAFMNPLGYIGGYGNLMGGPTHALVLSSLSPRWFDFLAGFSCGSHLPFLIYGEAATTGLDEGFASFFTLIETEEELRKYLVRECEEYKKREAAMDITKARNALLQTGIPINEESLSNCAGEGGIWEVSLFLAAGFSPDTRNKAGVPLLNTAARKGNYAILRYLILVGAQLDLTADDRGSSALIDSVMNKHHEMAADLIKAGADLNIASKDGQTALTLAVGASDDIMVEALLKAGANPDISDHMGLSARKYATLFKKSSLEALFEKYAPKKPE